MQLTVSHTQKVKVVFKVTDADHAWMVPATISGPSDKIISDSAFIACRHHSNAFSLILRNSIDPFDFRGSLCEGDFKQDQSKDPLYYYILYSQHQRLAMLAIQSLFVRRVP